VEILWLGQPACGEVELVGGKVANLSRLAAEYRVPPGFCLSIRSYDRWAPGLREQDLLPPECRAQLQTAYAELARRCGAEQPSAAVRSSAVDEDGRAASFAGQYETYLNRVGAEEVERAVRDCWASMRSERVREYRRRYGLPLDRGQLAVLVQQLVPADVSAVVFSADPVSGDREVVVVNASWGLGESIVGGTVSPDAYQVRKADLQVVERRIADKERMTVLVPGGTGEVGVPRFLRTQPALDEAQLAELARLALALEAYWGWPVDAECAFKGGELYLLQCRPITTLIQPEQTL
jgi:pyruvate,water dikinase